MLLQKTSQWVLKILGWKIEGTFPFLKKCVIIGAPHTSNWDFLFALLFGFSMNLHTYFLMKKELFFFPLGNLLKKLGGIPVDRGKSQNTVERMRQKLESHEKIYITLTPEGTRQRVKRWKYGFYHIASLANVPILPAYLDYKRKVIGIGQFFRPTGEIDTDMQKIRAQYKNVTAKYPENFALPEIESFHSEYKNNG